MRMRKKPWARPELEACKFFIQNPSEYKGRWKEFFGNDKPIYMELGCGKGTFMAVHGSENPDKNYITIDIKDEVLVLAKRNIEAAYEKKGQEIDNVALMSQASNIYFPYTVYETVALGRYAHLKGVFSRINKEDDEMGKITVRSRMGLCIVCL